MTSPLITHCILSLGSNHQAEQNLKKAQQLLQNFFPQFDQCCSKSIFFSRMLCSIDNNAILANTTSPNQLYVNQIAWVEFSQPITLERYTEFTKFLEKRAQRHKYTSPIVTLDIDILIVKPINPTNLLDFSSVFIPLLTKNSQFFKMYKYPNSWYANHNRLPFATYDKAGINYLLFTQFLENPAFLPLL